MLASCSSSAGVRAPLATSRAVVAVGACRSSSRVAAASSSSSSSRAAAPQQQQLRRSGAATASACRPTRRSVSHLAAAATEAAAYGAPPATNPEAYIVLGLAHCFEKSEEGKLVDRMVIEPVSANSLECMAAGGKTSFVEVAALRAGQAMSKDRASMPAAWGSASFCEDWAFRVGACARTWGRPHAADNLMDLVPLGSPPRGNWNFNLDDKRVLGVAVEVSDDDNIKQDISIDVYGRGDHADAVDGGIKEGAGSAAAASSEAAAPLPASVKKAAAPAAAAAAAAPAAAAPAAPAAAAPVEEEDELDALLMD